MKNIKTLAVVSVLGLAICGFAIAQGHRGGARGHGTSQHLTEAFAKFAPFDANKDGQLDATEKASLAKAIAEGTVQLPAHHTPPNGVTPSAEMTRNHIADMYAVLAPYDANHDGALDATEQATLKSAIDKGELAWPSHPHGQRSHGDGGPHH